MLGDRTPAVWPYDVKPWVEDRGELYDYKSARRLREAERRRQEEELKPDDGDGG